MSTREQILALIKTRPVAIFGMGTSGRGAAALAAAMGFDCTFFDQRELPDTRADFTRGDAHQHSIVITSPGFADNHPWLTLARAEALPILNELDFGSLFLSKPVWAVTGTNGKTTTTEFIGATFSLAGRPAITLGNNGRSLCSYLAQNLSAEPTTEIILEISSFQARSLWLLPLKGLVWTTFSENHLDFHTTSDAYFAAKWRLVERLVEPVFVCGRTVFEAARDFSKALPNFALVVNNAPLSPYDSLPEATAFAQRPFDEDFRLCVALGERMGLPAILWHESARRFAMPPYRMSKTARVGTHDIFNDAKSTTPASTLACLERFSNPVVWIGGGKSKGGSLAEFAKTLSTQVSSAHLIGATSELMSVLLQREGVPTTTHETLAQALAAALAATETDEPIVFSPAFSSLDQFENFAQRGLFFDRAVFELQQHSLANTKR